jgi:hypothetical protein
VIAAASSDDQRQAWSRGAASDWVMEIMNPPVEDRLIAAACYPAAMRENPNTLTSKAASHTVKETAQVAR